MWHFSSASRDLGLGPGQTFLQRQLTAVVPNSLIVCSRIPMAVRVMPYVAHSYLHTNIPLTSRIAALDCDNTGEY